METLTFDAVGFVSLLYYGAAAALFLAAGIVACCRFHPAGVKRAIDWLGVR